MDDTDTIFHIYNRGVEKRDIFLDDADRSRFIASLILFNSTEATDPNAHRLMEVRLPSLSHELDGQLVELMAYCLMPNHYHLMIRQRVEYGLTKFMRKLGTGYTNYFNLRYSRVGALFQGRFKSKPVISDEHFNWLPHYIHSNPFDGSETSIITYPWSSFQDYLSKKDGAYDNGRIKVVDTSFLSQWFETPERFYQETLDWLAQEREDSSHNELSID